MWQKGAVKRRIIFCDLSRIELPNKNYKTKGIRKAWSNEVEGLRPLAELLKAWLVLTIG